AVDLLAQPRKGRRQADATPQRVVGAHPEDGKPITAGVGRYGPFVKHGSIYANLPRDRTPEEVTLDEAVALSAERAARGGGGKKPRKGKEKAEAKAAKGLAEAGTAEAKPAKAAKPKAKKAAPKAKKAASKSSGKKAPAPAEPES